MKLPIISSSILVSIMLLAGCSSGKNEAIQEDLDGWRKEGQVLKSINNVNFNFPDSGFAFENRDALVEECFQAMQSNSQIMGIEDFGDTIQIRFLRSRADMKILAGMTASGTAHPHIQTLYVVADPSEKIKPPIKHELMHLMAMLDWGYPHYTSTWINEGLATYAEDNCNGYSASEVYRYLLEKDMLLPIESLIRGFFDRPEMIAYHQSAYAVEYLIATHGLENFKRLWREGFDAFESIYGVKFQEMKKELDAAVLQEHPDLPNIDWESFKEGCMK